MCLGGIVKCVWWWGGVLSVCRVGLSVLGAEY